MKNPLLITFQFIIFIFLLSACSSSEEALLKAAKEGNLSKIEGLIIGDLDLNTKDHDGMTPLHLLARKGETQTVKLLLENGADPNSKNNTGMTPLFLVAENGNAELASLLISNGANTNEADEKGREPLHIAAQFGNDTIIKLFISNGSNPATMDLSGKIPSAIAAENGHETSADLLVKIMADIQAAQTAVLNRDYFNAANNYMHAGIVKMATENYILSLGIDDYTIKKKAIIALSKIGTDRALGSLKEIASRSDTETRTLTNFFLKRHGPEKLNILMLDSGESGRRAIDGYLASVGIITEYSQLCHLNNNLDLYVIIEKILGESSYVLQKLKIPPLKTASTPPEFLIDDNQMEKIRKNMKYDILFTTHSKWYEHTKYYRNSWDNPPLKMEIEYEYKIYIPALNEFNSFTYKFYHKETSELGKEAEQKSARKRTASIWVGKEVEIMEKIQTYLDSFF